VCYFLLCAGDGRAQRDPEDYTMWESMAIVTRRIIHHVLSSSSSKCTGHRAHASRELSGLPSGKRGRLQMPFWATETPLMTLLQVRDSAPLPLRSAPEIGRALHITTSDLRISTFRLMARRDWVADRGGAVSFRCRSPRRMSRIRFQVTG
jgi:hypothetical protein